MKTELSFPANHSHREYPSPFMVGPKQRPLRLFVDREHLAEGLPARFLDEFASYDGLELLVSHRDGNERLIFGERHDDIQPATIITDKGHIQTGVMFASQWDDFARDPSLRDGFTLPPGPWRNEAYRLRQYLLTQIAQMLRADVFVTDDPFLLDFDQTKLIRINLLSAADAVAVMGSYLRNRHDFTVRRSGNHVYKLGRGSFYWLLARDLLPAGWRWYSAIVESDEATSGALTGVGASALKRVEQALKARDHVHWQLLQSPNNETADEVLFFLDMMLLSLAAAFDVVARIADEALGLNSEFASWTETRWRRVLRDACSQLDSAMAPTHVHARVYKLLLLLRNTIHGEALGTLASLDLSGRHRENLLMLPNGDRRELRFLMRELGGHDAWGYEELDNLYTLAKPGLVTEQLLPRVATALNDLMALTPIEHLPGIEEGIRLMEGPPADRHWNDETRKRVRLLSGLERFSSRMT